MAVRHGYGKIAGTDALVFAYDTGDTRNSYKGEPTTNLTTDTPSQGGWSGTYEVLDSSRKTFRLNVSNFNGSPGAGWRSFTWDLNSYSGQSVTISATVDVPASSPGDFAWIMMGQTNTYTNNVNGAGQYLGYSAGSERVQKTTTTRERITWSGIIGSTGTANQPSGHVGFTVWYNNGTPGTNSYVEVSDVQIELKSHATPFVNGTRSATEGLLDLTGANQITVANVSFDSNAQMVFDGTDDVIGYINVGISDYSQPFTMECVFKAELGGIWANAYRSNIFGIAGSYAGMYGLNKYSTDTVGLYVRDASGGAGCDVSGLSKGVYYHIVGTWNGIDDIRFYLNGALANTTTSAKSGAPDTTAIWIGGSRAYSGAGGQTYHGEIPVAKYYNRALTASEVQNNFSNYRRRFSDLSNYYDYSTDGGRWIRFWWYTGVGWPGHETEALGHPFGTFDSNSHYGFQRLPEGLNKDDVELLAKDGSGNIYKWDFADGSETAQRVWDSMTQGTQGTWANRGAWNPTVIAGSFFNTDQDTWQYRVSEGVASFLLDDDTCDCKSTLNAGHAMCGGSSWNQTYAQPDGAYLRYGVDTLNDGGCLGPTPERSLELFYRLK